MSLPHVTERHDDQGVTKIIKVGVETIQINARYVAEGTPEKCLPAIVVRVPQPHGGHYNVSAYSVNVLGPCKIIQNDLKTDLSGARVWIETESEIECITALSNERTDQ
jgi:hypothetical protein